MIDLMSWLSIYSHRHQRINGVWRIYFKYNQQVHCTEHLDFEQATLLAVAAYDALVVADYGAEVYDPRAVMNSDLFQKLELDQTKPPFIKGRGEVLYTHGQSGEYTVSYWYNDKMYSVPGPTFVQAVVNAVDHYRKLTAIRNP